MENLEQSAAQSGTDGKVVGDMNRQQFEKINEDAAKAVEAVAPAGESFTQNDWELLLQVAVGGMRQLELSKIATDTATNDEVLDLAKAEVDEQTGLSDKLKEFADVKKLTLPSKPDQQTQEFIQQLQKLSGAEFDRTYVRLSGIEGHEKLDEVMSKIETEADDTDLRDLAKTAHPLIRVHLTVSNSIQQKLST